MRATAIKSNEIVGVAGFLYPGSHVDVLCTINVPNSGGTLTQTVLQDVEVLTAGQTIEPDPQGKPQPVDVVTLLLTPEDSQKLQLATTQGAIQFVLRNGTDTKTAELRPARLDQLVSMPKPPAVVTRSGKRVVVKAEPPMFSRSFKAQTKLFTSSAKAGRKLEKNNDELEDRAPHIFSSCDRHFCG